MNNTSVKQQVKQLIDISGAGASGYIVNGLGSISFALIDLANRGFVKGIVFEGPRMANEEFDSLSTHDAYEITEAGQAWLNRYAPMVDQPQPAPVATITSKRFTVLQQVEKTHKARFYGSQQTAFNWLVSNGYVQTDYRTASLTEKGQNELMPTIDQPADETTIEGDVSFYADGKPQDGVIVAGTDRYGYTVKSVDGKVYDEIKRGDIEPRLADEVDDLPFSDVGKEDTQEAPAVIDDTTPTLSNLIDAALDPENVAAYEALKAYDWTAPLWCIAIESDDLSQLAWNMWYELTKLRRVDPRYDDETRKVNRAFELLDILRNAVKAV